MGYVGILITCINVDYKISNTVKDKLFELAIVLQRNCTNKMDERKFLCVSIGSSDPIDASKTHYATCKLENQEIQWYKPLCVPKYEYQEDHYGKLESPESGNQQLHGPMIGEDGCPNLQRKKFHPFSVFLLHSNLRKIG